MSKPPCTYPPRIFNVFKPAGMSSYDIVRHFKKNLPMGYGKIGHFGTLDPFASGVLMIGVAKAARLNEYIHSYAPKTYLAVGKLGSSTETGDATIALSQRDDSQYLYKNIANFETSFIEKQLQDKFLGDYWQAPHKYSAAKFEGKALHQWAREGVEVKKEAKLRYIYKLEVVRYQFPYLSLRITVSSGTYIRTLFSDCAQYLGTLGHLVSLVREQVGKIGLENALYKKSWPLKQDSMWDYMNFSFAPDEVLDFPSLFLDEHQSKLYSNGVKLSWNKQEDSIDGHRWVYSPTKQLLGLAQIISEESSNTPLLKARVNFV